MARLCRLCGDPKRAEIERRMAAGETDGPLAKEYGYQSQQLAVHRLRHMPTSPAKLSGAALQAYNQALQGFAVASKAQRIAEIQSLYNRLQALIEARAADAENRLTKVRQLEEDGEQVPEGLAPLPGAETGLLSHDGEFDVYTLRESRSCLEQAAKELGEWDITGAGRREDTASGAAQVTIQQVIHGHSAIAVSADPRPGARQIPLAREPLTLPQPSISAPSSQSVHRDIDSETAVPGAAVRVDDGGGEG